MLVNKCLCYGHNNGLAFLNVLYTAFVLYSIELRMVLYIFQLVQLVLKEKDRGSVRFDRRMTGSSVIDEVLAEVRLKK